MRNKRVEAEKAWETSMVRVVLICGITYIAAILILSAYAISYLFRNALMPTLGFFLSVQSLP